MIMTLLASAIFAFYLTKEFAGWLIKVQRHIVSKILLINIYWRIYPKLSFLNTKRKEQVTANAELRNFKSEQQKLALSQGNISLLKLASVMSFTDYFVK